MPAPRLYTKPAQFGLLCITLKKGIKKINTPNGAAEKKSNFPREKNGAIETSTVS